MEFIASKWLFHMDYLLDAVAEFATNLVLRCIMDQVMGTPDLPHPVQLLIMALPTIFENPNDSAPLLRVAQSFWKVFRAMLFSQPPGQVEHLVLRSCLRSARDIPEEDMFLAARFPDGSALILQLIRTLVNHGFVHRAMDILMYNTQISWVRFRFLPACDAASSPPCSRRGHASMSPKCVHVVDQNICLVAGLSFRVLDGSVLSIVPHKAGSMPIAPAARARQLVCSY